MLAKRALAAAFGLIVVLAVYLRLAHLDLAEFKRDEADIALRAAGVLEGNLPLVGIGTSIPGLENGPLMIYLTALPLALARDAALASGFIGLMNVLALVVSARVTERAFGRLSALFAAAAYAVGSWAVVFSRKLWPNEAMPLFSALLALALYEAVVGGRARGVVLAGLWLGALLNLHPSGIVFVPFALLALALRPALLRTRAALYGAGLVVLVSLPFLIHELRDRFPTVRALRGVAGTGARVDASALEYALALVGPQAYPALAGDALPEFRARALAAYPIGEVMSLLVLVGVAVALVQLARGLRRGVGWRAPALLLLWLAIPILASSRRTLPLQIHYLIPLLPALFPFVGAALAAPFRITLGRSTPLRAAAVLPAVAFVLWAGVVQVQSFVAFVETVRVAGGRSLYGLPLVFQRTAVERAVTYAAGRPVVVVTQPGPDGADDLPPIWTFLTPRSVDLRFDDGGGALRLSPTGSLYVVAPSADPLVADLLADRGAPAGRGVPLPGLARGYEYWRAVAAPGSRASQPEGRLENGLRLDRATYPRDLAGATELRVVADWRAERDLPEEELAFFVHLLDDRGDRLASSDRSGLEAARVRPGDELITWGRLAPPPALAPGRYWFALGAYRARDVHRLATVDEAGRSVGDTIRIGPIKVPVPSAPPSSAPPIARFQQGIELVGAALPGAPVVQGQPISVALRWRATARPERDLTVFVHLVDAAGRVVAQDDRQPADRGYPTSIWDPGEQILDPHPLVAPPGRYRVVVGLYDPATLARLPRADGQGDSVEVGLLEAAAAVRG
jgi:hypothetical protein